MRFLQQVREAQAILARRTDRAPRSLPRRLARSFVTLFVLPTLLGAAIIWFRYGGSTKPFPDRTTPPLLSASAVETVATLEDPPGNIAVSPGGRVFFSFHPEARPPLKVVELVNGAPVPFPSESFDLFDTVLSVRVDALGRLWTIDHGFHALKTPRLLAFDLATKELVHRWDIPKSLAPLGSFAQDFAVSNDGRHVFIADAGIASKKPALVVYDTERKTGRRLLERDASVQDHPFTLTVQGKPLRLLFGLFKLHPGVDSIALDAAGEWLYFGAMSSLSLYRARTRDLLDAALAADELSRRVERWADKPQSDGIAVNAEGDVLLTDVEHGALSVITPDRKLATLVSDPRWRWPDGLALGAEDSVYVTDSALQDVLLKSRGAIRAKGPYKIWRVRTGAARSPGR